MKLTVRNTSLSPVSVHGSRGLKVIEVGDELTDEFTDAEAENMKTNSNLDVSVRRKDDPAGHADEAPAKVKSK